MERKSTFRLPYFLMGLLFILVSLLSFRDPQSSLLAIVYVFALSAILKGIFELFFRRKIHEFTNQKSTFLIVLGVFDLLVGIFFLFNLSAGLVALPFVFAIWFLFDSIAGLLTASIYKIESTGYYWFHVIVNVIGILLGIMLLFNPLTSALTLAFLVGFYFMMAGISLIAYSF
ncbi:HdeD family acid-resistance protein [Enterococcus sp. AZ196]|uniref:HdeD family acid-resistance protein n=1 Tax=Enterococcus sp. AZ196 TaxID=2774659 RepID=UPI003D29E847